MSPYSRLYLPDSFAMAMANRRPEGFWLQMEGCPNSPSWVLTEYTPDDAILLSKGWKAFARSRRLSKGQFLAFRFDLHQGQFLLVKIYRAAGGRIECCVESESSSNNFSFFDEDEDEENSSNVKAEASWSP